MIREKKHRLDPELYIGEKIISFTLCINERKNLFTEESIFKTFETILIKESNTFDASLIVYLFMPDHCHILIKGNSEQSDIKECIDMFKQKSGFWLARNLPDVRWQKDYYDHILRENEDLKEHIKYILCNPVRNNIVDEWLLYPYKGSTVFDFKDLEELIL